MSKLMAYNAHLLALILPAELQWACGYAVCARESCRFVVRVPVCESGTTETPVMGNLVTLVSCKVSG